MKMNKKIDEIIKLLVLSACSLILLSGCDYLQSTLSSYQNEKLAEETGSANYSYSVWYYNGYSGENMEEISSSASDEYCEQSLCVDFGQEIALSSYAPSGKMVINYSDSKGDDISKTITSLSGHFSSDYKSYYLDMSPVTELFDGNVSSATLDIKMTGFVCASGNQSGRPVNAFELQSLQVRPLFNKTDYDFSTVSFGSDTKYEIPLAGDFSLENGSYTVSGLDSSSNEYSFTVTASGNSIYLSPEFSSAPADQTTIDICLKDILAKGSGVSYSKDISLTFVEHLIVLDGYEDSNWSSSSVASVEDASGDTVAEGDDGLLYTTDCDITNLAITNDNDYLYISIKGSLNSSWGDGFAFIISKDHSSDIAYTSGKETFDFAESVGFGRSSLAHGLPDFYMYHQPQTSALGAWVEGSSEDSVNDISSQVELAVNSSSTFMEYAIPLSALSSCGIASGESVHLTAIFSAHWSAGNFAADIVPDSAASSLNENHSSIVFNMQNALEYQIQ
ncbi:MAG: hypothetical protein K5829_02770 [Treponema sp.]|nr:hypothetical protein [Treponema sp.]